MKILLITNLYEPYNRGGAEIVVKRTALALSRAGHEVVLLTARPFSGFSSLRPVEEKHDGLRILRYYPLNLFFYPRDAKHSLPTRLLWHALDQFNFHSARVIRRVLANEQPDVVFTHNLIGLGFSIPAQIRRAGIRHVHVPHDIQLAVRSGLMRQGEEDRFYTSGWLAKTYQALVRRQFGSPDVVVSPSQFLLDFYRSRQFFPASAGHVLRNPIDAKFYQQARAGIGKEVHVAYIGQLAEHKGLTVLREAMTHVADRNVRLHIFGGGPLTEEVRQWSDEDTRIHYAGVVPNEDVAKSLAQMDVLVLPTKTYENSPTVIFESLAAGVPVIVSDMGGAAEAVEEGMNGFRVPAGDVRALAGAINTFTATRDLSLQMSKACRDSVAGLDADAYVTRLMSLVLRDQNGR